MAIAYRNVSDGSGTSPATVTAPTGIQTGDIMILVAVNSGGNSITLPAGWTQIGSELPGLVAKAAYRVRQSGDTTYTLTAGGPTIYWQVGAWSGGDGTDPIVASNFAKYSADANIPLPSLQASSVDGDAAVYSIIGEGVRTYTTAANYTERWDSGNSQTIGDRLGLTASQSTSGTVVSSATDVSYVLHAILRNAVVGISLPGFYL